MQNIFTDFEHLTFWGQKNTTKISSWKIMTHLWLFVTFKKIKRLLHQPKPRKVLSWNFKNKNS